MQKTLKRLLISTLCVLMIFSAFPIATVSVDAAGQTAITLKQEKEFAYTNNWDRTVVQMTADGKMVYCVQPDLPAPPNGSYRTDNGKLSEITSSNSKYSMYRKALYYGYGGDGFNTSNNAFKTDTSKHQQSVSGNTPKTFLSNLKYSQYGYPYTSLSGNNLYYMFTHLLVSYIYYGDSTYKSKMGNYVPEQGYYTLVKEFYAALQKAPTPPVTTKLYMLNAGNSYQKVIVIRNGIKLQLQKSSSNSSVEYSLVDARYNIYLDKNCTDYFGYITTDEYGFGKYGARENGVDVPVQTYYCKEVEAPPGYALDNTVYEFKKTSSSVSGSVIYKATVTDKPLIHLQLMKSSANPDITDGNSCYSLEGAKYNIYLDKNCTDYFGYITTDSNGYGKYGAGENGVEVPVQTYYCKEVEAPKGYDLDDTVYTFKDSGLVSPDGIKIFRAYNGDKQPKDNPINDPIGIILQKKNAITGETTGVGLEGAVFQIQYYSELIDKDYDISNGDEVPQLNADNLKRTWYIKTDEDGTAWLHEDYLADNESYVSDDFYYSSVENQNPCIPVGTIVIKEVEAPPGYTLSDTTFYRPISEEKALIAQDTNTPIEVPIDEMPANGYIGIHKMNDSKQGVEGAVYGLYSDSAATALVSKLTTDSNGKGVFEFEAKVNQTYYIKEITAPTGYVLDTTIYPVTPTEKNTTVENAVIQDVYEEIVKGKLQILKTSEDNEVKDIWFKVTSTLGYDSNFVTDSDGFTPVIENLPIYEPATQGKTKLVEYTITELGYQNSDGTYTLPFKYNTPKSVTVTLDSSDTVKTVSIANTLKKGSVTLYKQDYNGKALAGSQWELYKSDGTKLSFTATGVGSYFPASTSNTTLSTDSNGRLYVYDLTQGSYYFIETKAPNGTTTYGKKVSFTVSGDDETTLAPVVTVKNNKIVMYQTGGRVQYLYITGFVMLIISVTLLSYYFKRKRSK